MKIEGTPDGIRISGLRELDEHQAGEIIEGVRSALPPEPRVIEFDLSRVATIDAAGVGVLLEAHDAVTSLGAAPTWRLLHPAPPVRQLLELVRLHRVFEIVPPRGGAAFP
ncbi:MAG TPA: STAS domain-containing protein [Opitutaceae bacterium]|nr:STAS domain-containing protein [Opitutaceae bacterium]